MDLDFSFTLVSSLTPRSKPSRTPLNDNKKPSSKSLKTKEKQSIPVKGYHNELLDQENKKNKENCLPKEQSMTKNVSCQSDKVLETKFVNTDSSSSRKSSFNFSLDMANIAVRKTRSKCIQNSNPNLPDLTKDKSLNSPPGTRKVDSCYVLIRRNSFCRTIDQVEKVSISSPEEFNSSNNSHSSYNLKKKGVKRKSPLGEASILTESSIDLVESSLSEINNGSSINHCLNKDPTLTSKVRRNSPRISGVSETSLSPAYDSDSFRTTRRRGAKVIHETPETDESLKNDFTDERECSLSRVISEVNTVDSSLSSSNSKNGKSNCLTDSKVASSKLLSPSETQLPKCMNTELEACPKKKLRSSNASSVLDIFRFESSIKNQPKSPVNEVGIKEKTDFNLNKKDKRKLSMSPVLRGIITKVSDDKRSEPMKGKKQKSKEVVKLGSGSVGESIRKKSLEANNHGKTTRLKISNQNMSPLNTSSPKSTLIPPSEVIPKFEHISNWLKDTQEKSIINLSSDCQEENSEKALKPVRQKTRNNKTRITLSPRIKRKKKIAQNTLEEEQKIFEEIHGEEFAKRLSDEVDEVVSVASSRDSVELSENVLEKLYGTVWKKNPAPQSEPRKPSKKKVSKKRSPQTERKKQRTSIYDVFSSSSSEDRFEEFLESVKRGKLDSTRRRSGRPGTPDFINDSNSDSDCSLVFYQNIVSSAVKEDVDKIWCEDTKSSTRKLGGRRLSFTSSKDDCSESGKSDVKSSGKTKKSSRKETKKDKPKSRSKKKSGKEMEENCDDKRSSDVNCFTLVTPIKIKDSTGDKLSTRIKNIIDPQVPKSVGKSRTPKNQTKQDENPTTEEKLRTKYLGERNFKVPKNVASLKTPTNSTKKAIPSSPALSFLSSLSDMTAGLPCHPDAVMYKKDFKNKREELSKKLFSLYNKEVFDNKLPADMLIQWNTRMTSTSGYCYNKRTYSNNQIFRSSRIVLSTKILDRADRLRDTLIHELCHAATWILNAISDGHGSHWRAWADKANRRFPELPVIKRCHDYAITTKFTYKCMSCGYCIGRHSKSLDTEKKLCGFCFGRFQVFVTAKMSTASATSGSDSIKVQTQRTPSGFALFVKDNYAAVKKENNVPHGQVMKLLSQKFAEVKISKQSVKELD